MRLDHISYVTSHDQLADTVQRLGSRLGSTFVDGGVHPRFGTRNFTMPLLNGQYLEVVCPLDHPATETSPFGKAVSQRAEEGGGWLTWVFSVSDISKIESRLGRLAVDGHRTKPDGIDLKWKQIGVLGTLKDRQFPFFIEWLNGSHPSLDGKQSSKIEAIEILGNREQINNWLGLEVQATVGNKISIKWIDEVTLNEIENGIVAVHLDTPNGKIRID